MRMFRWWMGLGMALVMLAGLLPVQAQAGIPHFEPDDCPFPVPPGEGVECGYLVVPENRSRPDSPSIRLAVAILNSRSASPAPDPILYLEGGPGGDPLAFPEDWFDTPLREDRDVILLDQRGTGYSEPSLDCPELDAFVLDTLDDPLTDEEAVMRSTQEAFKCRDRLIAQGVNLSAYNSVENAADVADLRVALGLDEWNLYGISYGTRLALTVMRDHPDGVRSVVLDSVYPPVVDAYNELVPNGVRAFDALFAGCSADAACNTAFPDLQGVFFETVNRLNANPPLVDVTHPFSGEPYQFLLTGDALVEALFGALYVTEVIPYLPFLIYQVYEGEYEIMANLAMVLAVQGEFASEGMYYSVECNEEMPFNAYEQVLATLKDYPEFESFVLSGLGYEICAGWGAGEAAAREDEAVTSDIPTLIFAGEYDPITPPAWGQLAAETLSHSFFYEFPGTGHGVTVSSDCAMDVMLAFLDDPTTAPDAACVAALGAPAFVVP